jgi:hypothetical protein
MLCSFFVCLNPGGFALSSFAILDPEGFALSSFVILNPSEALRRGVKNLGVGKAGPPGMDTTEEDPSVRKPQDDLRE